MAVTESLTSCFECTHELFHCHGTAIVHLGGSFDCTDQPGCDVAAELHLFVAPCEDRTCCDLEE